MAEESVISMEDMSAEEKLALIKGEGQPVKPEGYDEMAEDHPGKLSYDKSVVTHQEQIALFESELADQSED